MISSLFKTLYINNVNYIFSIYKDLIVCYIHIMNTTMNNNNDTLYQAIGLNKVMSNSAIRIGIGRLNTKKDIEIAAENIIRAVKLKG